MHGDYEEQVIKNISFINNIYQEKIWKKRDNFNF